MELEVKAWKGVSFQMQIALVYSLLELQASCEAAGNVIQPEISGYEMHAEKVGVDGDSLACRECLEAASSVVLSEKRLSSMNDEFLFSSSRLIMRVFLKPPVQLQGFAVQEIAHFLHL